LSGSSSTSRKPQTAERIVQGAGYVEPVADANAIGLQGERLGNAIRAGGE
jgi:hypothetical protein